MIVGKHLVILIGMTHTVGTKGQVVIPKAIRERLGIRPGDRVEFAVEDDAVRVVPAEAADLLDLRGVFGRSGMAARLLEDRRAERR